MYREPIYQHPALGPSLKHGSGAQQHRDTQQKNLKLAENMLGEFSRAPILEQIK